MCHIRLTAACRGNVSVQQLMQNSTFVRSLKCNPADRIHIIRKQLLQTTARYVGAQTTATGVGGCADSVQGVGV